MKTNDLVGVFAVKVSLTHYGQTVSVERDTDDLDIDAMLDMLEVLLMAAGFLIVRDSLTVTTEPPR